MTQGNHVVIDSSGKLEASSLMTRIIQYTGVVGKLTLPSDMEIGIPTGIAFDFYIINSGLDVTLAENSNLVLVGNMIVSADTTGCFRLRKTNENAFTIYRLS